MLPSLRLVTSKPQTSRLITGTGTISTINVRCKHSKTQIKRIFKQNPAFLRVASRNKFLPKSLTSQPPPITIQPLFAPTILPNGWSAPPDQSQENSLILQQRDGLPFLVRRTGNKPNNAIGFLPVYSSIRLGGTKQTTVIKKIKGDQGLFLNELRAVLEIGAEDEDSIRVRGSGASIEVNGNRVREVKTWLAGLGF
jgi:hypothetical protein